MITKTLPTLKINKLSEEQYKRAYEAGNTNEDEFYLTPDNTPNIYSGQDAPDDSLGKNGDIYIMY